MIEWALDQGFAVIACDLPGHGLSSGERASIKDFAEYQSTLQGLLAEAQSVFPEVVVARDGMTIDVPFRE